MPELSRFYGIVIKMYFADHAPPHFHAEYADAEVLISIETLANLRVGFLRGPWASSLNGRHCIRMNSETHGERRVISSRSGRLILSRRGT